MDLFKLFGTIAVDNTEANNALDETSEKGGETESKLSKGFTAIGKGVAKVGKVVAVGMAAGATAIAGLATKSIQSYADYEQLVGGVETLFKDSAGKVQEYADKAYQTAGLSANEYMETVTSFSAALLQSLDGDTAKAAETADRAIIDMSDNANKMGSSMESIQTAYQGFAKQNYTMLDNLKLGYGGTKEEMQRLLNDAEKISGQKFDLSSYADVVDAIHVVQTEMGITGTTAKEASSTISGSIGQMKSSWQNLLTAMANEDSSWDEYIKGFVDSVSSVADNLMPVIGVALDGVVLLINDLAPKVLAKIPELLSQLLPNVVSSATSLIDSIVNIIPGLIDAFVSAIPAFIEGFVQIFNSIAKSLPIIIKSLTDALPTLIPLLVTGLVEMIVILATMLPQIIQPIIDNLPTIIISIVEALMNNLPALIEGFVALFVGVVQAMPEIITGLIDAMPYVIKSVTNGLKNAFPILKAGWEKIWENIRNSLKIIATKIKDVAVGKFNELKNKAIDVFNATKEKVVSSFQTMKDNAASKIEAMKSAVSSKFEAIKSKIGSVMETVKTKVKNAIEKVKGMFNFNWSLPELKMPHFKVSGGKAPWGFGGQGSLPSVRVEWYKKGYDKAMVLDDPTIFGYNQKTGKFLGGGDGNGNEIVAGESRLMTLISNAVAAQNESIAYYLQQIIDVLATFFPQVIECLDMDVVLNDGVLVGRIAPKMDKELGRLADRKGRGR